MAAAAAAASQRPSSTRTMASSKVTLQHRGDLETAFDSPTFMLDMSIKVDAPGGAMSISPSSRDVVLASRKGLHIVDLDNPYDPPRFLQHLTAWSVADVQWSPHASHTHWVVSTSNQKAIVWNLALPSNRAIEHVLHAHTRAITDVNFSAHDPNLLSTCSVDSFVHVWDLRTPRRPAVSFCDWFAGATQTKFNRQNKHILASSHDRHVYIWDMRRGAQPLRKINAHATKIYGLDWNRTRPSGLITCALDKTVKFWDYELTPNDTPERVLHTSFPVWRARHTPFGWGVLAMPQRGDTSLWLWDRRAKGDTRTEPVAKFDGHTDHVKEFLWRWRGGQREDGLDDREFQLVSWSLDRDIRLWQVDKDVMAKIGHDPTRKMRFTITRKGAKYMTFRDEKAAMREYGDAARVGMASPEADPGNENLPGTGAGKDTAPAGIGKQLSLSQKSQPGAAAVDDRRYEKALAGTREGGFMRARNKKRKEINPIMWMKGIKIGRKSLGGDGLESSRSSHRAGDFSMSWDAPENLGDEISFVGSKFPKISFDKVNISARTCTISLTGPWGADDKWVFMRADVSFPQDYPSDGSSIPEFTLEKTTSIPEANIEKAQTQLRRIALAHVNKKRFCLEACLCYLLGERAEDAALVGSDEDGESSSSDDEGIINLGMSAHNGVEDEEGVSSLIQHTNQSSVPLPKACGAMWTHDGRLICFFPPKEEKTGRGLLSSLATREAERHFRSGGSSGKAWEGFGRLYADSYHARRGQVGSDGNYNDSSSSFTSSGSSDESEPDIPLRPLHWRLHGSSALGRGLRRGGSTDRSTQRSTGTGVKTLTGATGKVKNVVSIHDMSHLLPAKKDLAKEYRIYGSGPEVCKHNSEVAERAGYPDLADVWRLVELILCNEVPLEMYDSTRSTSDDPDFSERILVMARRISLMQERRDSGLSMGTEDAADLEDDEVMTTAEAEFWGRVKWGGHPLGSAWLVKELFTYFEKKADIQMLAMLSCVLSEDKKGGEDKQVALPPSMRTPAWTDDYFPNVETVIQSQQPTTLSISPSHPSATTTPIGTHGSYGSSIGVNFSDPVMPFSASTTPPTSHLHLAPEDYGTHSLSSSPEHHHHPHHPQHLRHHQRRSTASIANFAGNIRQAFNTTSGQPSPPNRKRPSPAESMLNMNTTIPWTTSGVTWGAITTFGSRSKGANSIASESIPEHHHDDAAAEPVSISMYNHELFDDEATIFTPLLERKHAHLFQGYRENYADLLYIWGLPLHRLEVLKFSRSSSSGGGGDDAPTSPVIGSFVRRKGPGSGGGGGAGGGGWDGLEIAGHCSRCGSVLAVTRGAKGECKSCKTRQSTMTCVVCEVIIKGLYGPCLKCGHVAHADCHREWFRDGGETCPTGCGCECLRDEVLWEDPALRRESCGGYPVNGWKEPIW